MQFLPAAYPGGAGWPWPCSIFLHPLVEQAGLGLAGVFLLVFPVFRDLWCAGLVAL